jgi:hypothetical protein
LFSHDHSSLAAGLGPRWRTNTREFPNKQTRPRRGEAVIHRQLSEFKLDAPIAARPSAGLGNVDRRDDVRGAVHVAEDIHRNVPVKT